MTALRDIAVIDLKLHDHHLKGLSGDTMADERVSHWEEVYREKDDTQLSWHQDDPSISLELCDVVGVDNASSVIDIGGGTSRFAERLIERGLSDVSVLDVSKAALDRSRGQLGAVGEQIEWIAADVTTWSPERSYDLWHDRAVFHFLVDADDRSAYRDQLYRCLLPGSHAIIATFALDGPKKCSGLPIVRYDPEGLCEVLGDRISLVTHREHTHHTPWGSSQSFQFSLLRVGQ
jgi:SAM-dependent methyltransferase